MYSVYYCQIYANIRQKSYPQAYLEQCKYKVKRREMKHFVDYEIDLDYVYESD